MASSYEELRRLADGGRLGDYLPVVGWYHFPLVDDVPQRFVEKTAQVVDDNDFDFVKIMTNGNYLPIAYGADYEYSRDPHKWDGVFHSHPITNAADAAALPVLDPHANPTLSAELGVTRDLVARYRGRKPVIATVFDPLSWVQELSTPLQPAFTLELLRTDPDALTHALEAIAQTNAAYLDALVDAGIDGVFLSTKFSTAQLLTPDEHARFALPYLRQTEAQLDGRTWFNLLHVHGDAGLYFDDLLPLGFNAYNWEAVGPEEGLTTLAELRAKTDRLLITGFDHLNDFFGTPDQVRDRLVDRLATAIDQNAGGPFVFGPGCALTLDADEQLFSLISQVAADAGLR